MIPVKALPAAKTRLLPAAADADGHARLVAALRSDTLRAARSAAGVARVVIVTDRAFEAGDAEVLVQTRPGLNPALVEAATHVARSWPADGIAALVGDLPALGPGDLADVLRAAAGHDRSFVPDAAGTGTTALAVRPGIALHPGFGPGSAKRHAAGAVPLEAAPGVRCDVDTAADLQAAIELGIGPATAAALDSLAGFARSP